VTRLGWAPGLGAHVLGADEVALLREEMAVALRGRTYAQVTPLIDGRRSADEVVAALDGGVDPAVAHYALLRLLKLGHVVAANGTAAVPDRLYPVAVELPGGVEGVISDDYLRPELDSLVRRRLAAGRPVLPARPVGDRLWLGPLLKPGEEAVWALLLERLRLNRPSDVAALGAGAAFPLVPVDCSRNAVQAGLALLGSLRDRGDLRAALLTLRRENAEVVRHPIAHVSRRPPWPPPEFGASLPPLELRPAPKHFGADGGHRTVPPQDTLARLAPVGSALTGVVSEPTAVGNGPTPVYAGSYAGRHAMAGRRLTAMTGAGGKGMTDVQARASCTAEAVERYSCGFFGSEPRRRARLAELGGLAIDPRSLVHFSEAQFAARAAGQTPKTGFNVVCAPFDPDQRVEWTPVRSLVNGATRWVPSAHCFFGYQDPEAEGEPFAGADSNGCAAGNTFEEAALQGLLELIERDAVAMWWYSRARRPGVDLASFQDHTFDRIAQAYTERGEQLHVLDLTVDTGVSVLVAVRCRADGTRIGLGLGAHLDPRIAMSRALSEMSQIEQVEGQSSLDPAIARWLETATTANQPYVLPAGALRTAGDLPRFESPDLCEELKWCVAQVTRLGHDVLVYDHTQPDVGFPVVRVMAPGLRHFWQRLAPGRLYEVPVALRWITQRLTEDELNPIGFFL
jgi:oxazoline/thiazoline synthase